MLFLGKLLTEWKAYLVKNDVPLKNVRKRKIGLASRYLLPLLSDLNRFRELARFRIRGRESAKIIGVFAAGKLHGLFGELDCPVAVPN